MSLSTSSVEDAIEERLKTINPRVYISEVPDDVSTPKSPYIVVYFGGPIRAAGDHHITSSRNDTNIFYCTVQVIGRTDKAARDVNNLIRDSLTGFRPPDCGEMVLEGGLSYSSGNGDTKPTDYYRETGYSMRTNLSWND
jgi:hypothetical protein